MKSRWTLALTVCAVCTAQSTLAQNSQPVPEQAGMTESSTFVPPERQPSGSPGLMVFIDPATGKVREPLPGEVDELLRLKQQAPPPSSLTSQPVPITLPGGGVGMVLDESSHSYMVVTQKPDGTMLLDCLPDGKQALDAVNKGLSTGEILQKKAVLDVQ